MEIMCEYWFLIIPIVFVELALMVVALIDLKRREAQEMNGSNKIIWALIIIFVQLLGPIFYLTIGRKS
jgi:hypothetical protein